MTKRQARAARSAAWAAAVDEGRVVRYGVEPAITFKAYGSSAQAHAAAADLQSTGIPAAVVVPREEGK